MNKTSLWAVVVVAAAWIGFLLGYSVSAHTGVKPTQAGAPAAAGGGYGGAARPAASGGYGGTQPAARGKPAAGGYGR